MRKWIPHKHTKKFKRKFCNISKELSIYWVSAVSTNLNHLLLIWRKNRRRRAPLLIFLKAKLTLMHAKLKKNKLWAQMHQALLHPNKSSKDAYSLFQKQLSSLAMAIQRRFTWRRLRVEKSKSALRFSNISILKKLYLKPTLSSKYLKCWKDMRILFKLTHLSAHNLSSLTSSFRRINTSSIWNTVKTETFTISWVDITIKLVKEWLPMIQN